MGGAEVATPNVDDAAGIAAVLPEEPGNVYADSAFTGREAEDLIRARGGIPWTVWAGTWGGAEALAARFRASGTEPSLRA